MMLGNRIGEVGDVAQLVRALPCHGRGRGFEPRRPRHELRRRFVAETKVTVKVTGAGGPLRRK